MSWLELLELMTRCGPCFGSDSHFFLLDISRMYIQDTYL